MVKKININSIIISLYKCNEKHNGTYIEANLYNSRTQNIVVVKIKKNKENGRCFDQTKWLMKTIERKTKE